MSVVEHDLVLLPPLPQVVLRSAACRSLPFSDDERMTAEQKRAEFMTPEHGPGVLDAKRVCARCPVLEPCRQYALEHFPPFGVWGGTSVVERKRLRKATA